MREDSVITDGEPVRLVCLSIHHKNIRVFVTHDLEAHIPSPVSIKLRTGSVVVTR